MYSVHNNDKENILSNFCWGLSTTGIFIDYSFAVILISRIEFESLIHFAASYIHPVDNCIFLNRDNAKRLVYENDVLQMQMSNTERDTLDVITYLKQEDGKKDEQVCHYRMSL